MKAADREYHAANLVDSAVVWWRWSPTLADGVPVAYSGGPEITADLVSATAFRSRCTGRSHLGWVAPTESVRDAVAVLRGLTLTGEGPREADAGADELPVGSGDSEDQLTRVEPGTEAASELAASQWRHPSNRRNRTAGGAE